MPETSRIFSGHRALGYNSNHVPLCTRYHEKHRDTYVVTCVGDSFHTYNCSRLGIISISNRHDEEITCLSVDAYLVFTGCGETVRAFTRGRQVCHTYEGHDRPVHLLLPFGKHLVSIDEDSQLKVWDIASEEVYLEIGFQNDSFQISAILHPTTYLNKILLGSKQGQLQLWNIKTNKKIYTFTGWGQHVTVLEQAPAVDLVAVGHADGQIIIHNFKYDETLMKFKQDWGPITAITFRTDGEPIMVSGSHLGHIALWNLEEKRLSGQIREAHIGSVTGMKCLPREPLMVTSGPDNSLKVWIFDQSDGGGRLLRQRSGHSAPPNRIRFYGNDGSTVISAGQDSSLRLFSTVHDSLNKSLGRASFNKTQTKKSGLKNDHHMMPPVTKFAAELSRQSDWDNIVCCHHGLCDVTTWTSQGGTMGKYRLKHERFQSLNATAEAVDITSCGNFALIGYSTGHVDTYNVQSGLYRGSYGNPKAHSSSVRSVKVDGLNQVTITAASSGIIKFWRFKKKDLLGRVELKEPINDLVIHRESSLLAVSLDDFSVSVLDVDTRKLIRSFSGHLSRISDMAFSPDARWLITASMDSRINTWDIPVAKLIDSFIVESAVTSLTMSPTGEYLATSHVDYLGVYIWSNKTLYSHVSLRPLPEDFEPLSMAFPDTSQQSEPEPQVDILELEDKGEDFSDEFTSPEQISDELVTLSLLPASRWQNLLHLDIIKLRNKPKQPPKVSKSAPFFLLTVPGLEMKFQSQEANQNSETSKVMKNLSVLSLSQFGQAVANSEHDQGRKALLDILKERGPSALEADIRSLSPEGGGTIEVMAQFMDFISSMFNTRRDFELFSAYLALFIKVHANTIASEKVLQDKVSSLLENQSKAWTSMENKFNESLCLLNYLRSAAL